MKFQVPVNFGDFLQGGGSVPRLLSAEQRFGRRLEPLLATAQGSGMSLRFVSLAATSGS